VIRADLQAAGAPVALLESIDPLVPDAHLNGECLAVVADATGPLVTEHEPDPPKFDVGRWTPVPVVRPLIEWRQSDVPHVVVLIDRRGADLLGFRRESPDVHIEAQGDDSDPIRKVSAGGWSQRRYQQRAEDTWEHNAKAVADRVVALVRMLDARLIVVAGDVRAVQLLRNDLPRELDDLVVVVSGGRDHDGSTDHVADEVTRQVATVAAADTVRVLEKFREELGQQDRASSGTDATIAALNEARCEVLLVPGDIDDSSTAWFGAGAVPIARDESALRDLGVEERERGPLLDVLVRAALGTGSKVRIVPAAAIRPDGVGAILRW
jgi:peptide subunit release factor 1 (eRF1)